jgi:TolB-like protein
VSADSAPASIAVLPFTNLGGVPENEVFADGITEDVIAHLARAGGLMVISRTSVQQYKGTTRSIRDIAAELGVATVLEGSVRRDGSRVRVVAQLIDARTDVHRWAGTFDRELADIFAIQSEVAQTIADTLRVTLSPATIRRMAKQPTSDTLAYQLYIQGSSAAMERRSDALRRAIGYFDAAIARDSSFAEAFVGKARALSVLPYQSLTLSAEIFPAARAAVNRALALDPDLPEALATRGFLAMAGDFDMAAATRDAERALAAAPGSPDVIRVYSNLLVVLGRYDEGVREARRLLTLDPHSPAALQTLGTALQYARRYQEALTTIKPLAVLQPGNRVVWNTWIQAAWQSRNLDETLAGFEGMYAAGLSSIAPADLRRAAAGNGFSGLADVLRRRWPRDGLPSVLLLAEAGDWETVLAALERAYQRRESGLPFRLHMAALDPIRDDPRFVAIVRRMGISR